VPGNTNDFINVCRHATSERYPLHRFIFDRASHDDRGYLSVNVSGQSFRRGKRLVAEMLWAVRFFP